MKRLFRLAAAALAATLAVLALGIAVFWKQLPFRLVLPYLVGATIPMTGTVERHTLEVGGEQLAFFVYLPEGYAQGIDRYPTLTHLHGAYALEGWARRDCEATAQAIEREVALGSIDPMIVICPHDPDLDSMWSDSHDGKALRSTNLVRGVVAEVDRKFRTLADPSGRVLQGFSMGGFGAVSNGYREPQLFSTVIIWDGALHDWNTLNAARAQIAERMYATEANFAEWSPYEAVRRGKDMDIELVMVLGEMEATNDFASRFRPLVSEVLGDYTFFDAACPHSLFCMLDERAGDVYPIVGQRLRQPMAIGD